MTNGTAANIKWDTTGVARTPQGVVELENNDLLLGFSAYDFDLPPHYHLVRPHAQSRKASEYSGDKGPVCVCVRACVCGASLLLLQPSWPHGNQHESMGVAKLQFADK